MAAVVTQMFIKKGLGNGKFFRDVGSRFLAISRLSTEAQPQTQILEEQEEIRIDPLKHPDYFGVNKLFTVKDLFDARVHYGHKIGTLNKHMIPFVYGKRFDYLIIDLDQTAELLREALNFTAHIAYQNGIILFVSRNPQVTHLVEKTAMECGEYAMARKWPGGIFTNSKEEFKAVTRLPDLCILMSTLDDNLKEHKAVVNSAKMNIPTISICDTNSDPRLITYPVPGNDDTINSTELYCKLFKQAILLGKEARKKLESTNK